MNRILSVLVISIFMIMSTTSMTANFIPADSKEKSVEVVKGDIVLCAHCGEIKGSANCCNKEAKRCGCGAIKGSPGCCAIAIGGEDVVLCRHCGQVKGSDVCCIVTAEKCDKCGKAKGSLGCCLLVEETGKDKHDHLDQVPN